jgi:uncharacterized protein YneF (UPF0154 family)
LEWNTKGLEVQMLQTCLGIYMVVALLAFLIFLGTFIEAQNLDEELQEGT